MSLYAVRCYIYIDANATVEEIWQGFPKKLSEAFGPETDVDIQDVITIQE